MLETRWFDCGTGYCVLAMDPATSGITWEQVATRATDFARCGSPQLVDGVFAAPWGYEEDRGNAEAQAAHIDMCKTETLRLAELALAPQPSATVTLFS